MVNGKPITLPTLREGSRNPHVHLWQRIVSATPDGWFGPKTDKQTRVAQQMLGVKVDGIVGSITWRAALD